MLGLAFDKRVELPGSGAGWQSCPSCLIGLLLCILIQRPTWYQGNRNKELFVTVMLLTQHILLNRQKDDLTASQDTGVTQLIQSEHLW